MGKLANLMKCRKMGKVGKLDEMLEKWAKLQTG